MPDVAVRRRKLSDRWRTAAWLRSRPSPIPNGDRATDQVADRVDESPLGVPDGSLLTRTKSSRSCAIAAAIAASSSYLPPHWTKGSGDGLAGVWQEQFVDTLLPDRATRISSVASRIVRAVDIRDVATSVMTAVRRAAEESAARPDGSTVGDERSG